MEMKKRVSGSSKSKSTTTHTGPRRKCLYNFASYVAFVTFRQKNLKEIQREVGRLLRSNIFNPALRERTIPKKEMKTDVTKEAKAVTFSFRKSTEARQPAIRSVMDQRSPVLSTLLPMAKDSAQYLFQNHYLRPGKTSPSYNPEDLPELSSVVTTKVGIIGAPRNRFIPHTLMPIRTLEEEEEEDAETLTRTSASSVLSQEMLGTRGVQGSGSRPSISRATTEGDYVVETSK